MDNEVSNTFYEVQAEKFYQKKVEVARGVIELGQILIETKEKLPHGSWIKWLEDSRVGFTDRMARKYMKIANEFKELGTTSFVLNNLSLNKLYTLASAPGEVKEDVANSKDKEEAEKKIKEYEEQLKQEKLAKEALIKNTRELQEQLEQLKQEKQDKKVSSINQYLDVEVKKERKPIPKTVEKSVRVRSGNRCERCGYDFNKFPIEEFHHVNENPSDNRVDNILHICPNCHALEHYILRGGKLNE